MVTRGLGTAVLLVAAAHAARADEVDREAPMSRTWIDAEVDLGIIESRGDAVAKLGLGVEVRQRIVGGLRVGVRGAVLALRGQRGSAEMPDHRRGIGLTAGATIDYVIPYSRWIGIRWTIAPEVGASVTQLRGLGAGDGVVRSVFAGPRLGLEMAMKSPRGTPALMSARTWGAHLAFHVVEAGGETSWQAVVGYDWGR
jgi:hypothetical protein